MRLKVSIENFIKKAKLIHGEDKYDYSLVIYNKMIDKVKIICKEHGIFEQSPNKHIDTKRGCPKCGGSYKLTITEFLEKCELLFNNKYDYSLVEYKNRHSKVKIICKEHGVFEQSPASHLSKHGCPKCGHKNRPWRSNIEEFLSKSIIIHGETYIYDKTEYKSSHIKCIITCRKHGDFKQSPRDHLLGQGCNKCKKSKGVEMICEILKNKNINHYNEQTINGCKSPKNRLLMFDIYIPEMNTYIEYDGIQHFKEIEAWGGKEGLKYRKICDEIKNNFCLENNIPFYRISYMDNIIEEMDKILNI